MAVITAGVAGSIGSHVDEALLERGESGIGLDNLNDYFDPAGGPSGRASGRTT